MDVRSLTAAMSSALIRPATNHPFRCAVSLGRHTDSSDHLLAWRSSVRKVPKHVLGTVLRRVATPPAVQGERPDVSERGDLVDEDSQGGPVIARSLPVPAKVRIEPVGIAFVRGNQTRDDVTLTGVEGHPLSGVHDEVCRHGLENRALGPRTAGHDEPAGVAGQWLRAVLSPGGLLDGGHEPPDEV